MRLLFRARIGVVALIVPALAVLPAGAQVRGPNRQFVFSRLAQNAGGAQVAIPWGIGLTEGFPRAERVALPSSWDAREASQAWPARAARAGWSIEPTPNPRAPTGQLLFGTCATASWCIAVGTYAKPGGVGLTLAEHWNGARWKAQRTPNPARGRVSSLMGVACTSPKACTAVGGVVSDSGREVTLVERWNGRRWRIQSAPNPSGASQSFLFAVSCPSSSSCTSVGGYQTPSGRRLNLAERWNGRRWKIEGTPDQTGTHFTVLDGVSCTGPSACTAVGGTDQGALAERWNGRAWHMQRAANPSRGGGFLGGVVCLSPSSCTAAGGSNSGTLVERWDGRRWHLQATPNPAGAHASFFNALDCSSRGACTAVGGYAEGSGDFRTLAERWSGRKWIIQRSPSPGGAQGDFLTAVSCRSASSCLAMGFSHGSGTPLTMAQQWTGRRWQLQQTPSPIGSAESALSGVACPNASACIAVGTGANRALSERWDGRRWRTQPIPTLPGAFLNGISCTSSSACIAVGGSRLGLLAERWNGSNWTIQRPVTPPGVKPTSTGFGGISCTSRSSCLAAGSYSTSSSPSGPVRSLVERWDGHHWTILPTPNPTGAVQVFLSGVSCTSQSACTVSGEQHSASGIVHTLAEGWNGTKWSIQPTPNPTQTDFASLAGVDCTGPSACLAVGGTDQGTLAESWDGTSWSIDPTPTASSGGMFFGISCPAANTCTAVGFTFNSAGGMLLAERWNGTEWRVQPTPLLPAAHDISNPAVACPTLRICVAVGGYENDGPGSVTLAERWRAAR